MNGKDFDCLAKVVIVGDSGTGKSSLMLRFAENTFSEHYISTIGVDFQIKTIATEGKTVKLQIWDTAGQERFRTITGAYYRGSDIVIMVFDVTNRASYDSISRYWLNEIQKKASDKKYLLILIGTKCDSDKRVVSEDDAAKFASDMKIPYFETSAMTGYNVDHTFSEISKLYTRVIPSTITTDVVPIVPKPTHSSWSGFSFFGTRCSIL